MRRLLFCLEELIRHVREHRGVVALAVSTITVAFFVLGLFLLVWVNVRDMAQAASDDARVQVFLKNGLDQGQRDAIRSRLAQEPAVDGVTYVSEEEALSRFKARLKDQAVLLEGLGSNPLPASFEVRLPLATITTPSTMRARMAASVTAATGGESKMSRSKFARRVSTM